MKHCIYVVFASLEWADKSTDVAFKKKIIQFSQQWTVGFKMIICQNGSAEIFQLDFCAYSDIKNIKSRISVDDENAWMQKVKLI